MLHSCSEFWCLTTYQGSVSIRIKILPEISLTFHRSVNGNVQHKGGIFRLLLAGWDSWYCGHYWPIVPVPDDRWWWLWRNWWNGDWQRKPKFSEKTCPSATLSTTNPTWLDPGSNPGRRGGNPATNHLSYGAATKEVREQWCPTGRKFKLRKYVIKLSGDIRVIVIGVGLI
jgi:hypothetical protein